MDHAEARELLELAAVEPLGFERLMAGDTNDAAALAGHLAGCESCADEMNRLREASGIIREVVRTTPPPELRDRTLAFVRDVGRDRTPAVARAGAGTGAPTSIETALPDGRGGRSVGSVGSLPTRAWLGAIAATLVVAVGVTAFVV